VYSDNNGDTGLKTFLFL